MNNGGKYRPKLRLIITWGSKCQSKNSIKKFALSFSLLYHKGVLSNKQTSYTQEKIYAKFTLLQNWNRYLILEYNKVPWINKMKITLNINNSQTQFKDLWRENL